jgi:leucyl-tRNA synthetase
MFEYLKFRWNLYRLFRDRDNLDSFYKKAIQKAEKDKRADVDGLIAEALHEQRWTDEDISILITNYLVRCASRKFLPIPNHQERGMWEACVFQQNRSVLTGAGIARLRSTIRAEQKERRDMITSWVTFGVGIIGAMTGLIAVMAKY